MSNQKTITHGVFLNIFNLGVLITGQPGSGKSELALNLIDRGHQLIADDAPEFFSEDGKTIIGTCPSLIKGFLNVRNLGIINIKKIFGTKSIIKNAKLQLAINIEKKSSPKFITINNIKIPQISVKNQAILIETAVRNFILQKQGYDANLDFIKKQ
jgi:HPr kinase/phosphorylase